MRTISEQEIISLAPNGGAVMNGRKISSGGGFVSRMRSADDTFYMGECRGSGKSNYTVSADFVKEGAPVFRCSCPSRQFPCKHSIALLFEIASGKDFPVGEIPGDILDKRARQEAREEKKAKTLSQAQGGTESGGEKRKNSREVFRGCEDKEDEKAAGGTCTAEEDDGSASFLRPFVYGKHLSEELQGAVKAAWRLLSPRAAEISE